MMKYLRMVGIGLALLAVLAVGWVFGLIILAVVLLTEVARYVTLRQAVHTALVCELGHEVPTFGLYSCSVCRFTTASWYGRCVHCGAAFGHVRCPTCGRSVANPLTRGWPWV